MKLYTVSQTLLVSTVLTAIAISSAADAGYDLSKDKILYTIGYAHLDTQWRWDYKTTIDQFLKNTLDDNFTLFEKYPDYVFNFTGSRRYALMKEYYPEKYEKMKEYIKMHRWYVSGSSVDEGDVNIAGGESIVRQILYGNKYFREEFNQESVDYMLPDCFGFQACMPSIWAYCGLKGFSTQKLTWGSAVGVPFNIGVWKGIDGKGIICAFNPDEYTSSVKTRLDTDQKWIDRINENGQKYGVFADYKYYGVGDQGGSCRESDVQVCVESLNHPDSPIKVVLASSDQMYKDITDAQKNKLPSYQGDLLLTEHSAGTLTSQAYVKRWNRKNELLADSAERSAVIAQWLGGAAYPVEKLNRSWYLVLGSQFHDILPGTSIPRAYTYSWNDEILAMNGFASILQNSMGVVSGVMDTTVKGRALLVYNPLAIDREDIVEAEMEYPDGAPKAIQVYNAQGKEVPVQIISTQKNSVKFIFLSQVPSMGMVCYDIQPSADVKTKNTGLKISETSLENDYFTVQINSDGDVCSIYDKINKRETLSAPARLAFLKESPWQWPAWNMDWADRKAPPAAFVDGPAKIRIVENGPVRVCLEIERQAKNSVFTQQICLSAGDTGQKVEFKTNIDWQTTGYSLKATFPLTVENSAATYQMPLGTIERITNHPKKYEVPSHQWFDLSDGSYGVSILEDCKFGSDKPDNNTLRLTLLYTPRTKSDYMDQSTQDWGRHEMVYAIYPHAGDWRSGQSQWQAKRLNQPLAAFEVPAQKGRLKSLSMFALNTRQVDIMAVKKAESSDRIIVRLNELWGRQINDVELSGMAKILSAYEVDGQERKIGEAVIKNGKLVLDMTPYSPRSFSITLADAPVEIHKPAYTALNLAYTDDVTSYDSDKTNGSMDKSGSSIPAEMLTQTITSEDIVFKLGSFENGKKNALACNGQKITLSKGKFNKLYLLAAADNDVTSTFSLGDTNIELSVQGWNEFIGQYDNRIWDCPLDKMDDKTDANAKVIGIEKGYIKRDSVAWFCTHRHNSDGTNEAYSFSYLFKYALDIPAGAQTLTLPDNPAIKIFAVTVAESKTDNAKPVQPLYDDFTNREPIKLRSTLAGM